MNKACCWPLGLFILVLLGTSSCHLNRPAHHHSLQQPFLFDPFSVMSADENTLQHPRSPAQTLMARLEGEASAVVTPVHPEPAGTLQPSPHLPPLPVRSHLSVFSYLSHQGDITADHFTTELLPVTPDAPVLFTDPDLLGIGLGFDMGLTAPYLPLTGTAEWPLSVQAFCICPDTTGLHTTTDALARLDFATGRFRLAADFTGPNLRTAGLDLPLDRPRLLNRQSQQATADLHFSDSSPIRLDGDLHLYLSGREASQIGGEFSSAPLVNLSDILFVMQFVSRPTDP